VDTPSFSGLSSPSVLAGTPSVTLSGKISDGSLVPTGNVLVTLNGLTQSAGIDAGGHFSTTFDTSGLAARATAYAVNYSYAGDGNFSAASASGGLTVIPPASLSGLVFEDSNGDGIQDFSEQGRAGVTLTLTGTDDLGQKVNLT
jgi:hypothetical protein